MTTGNKSNLLLNKLSVSSSFLVKRRKIDQMMEFEVPYDRVDRSSSLTYKILLRLFYLQIKSFDTFSVIKTLNRFQSNAGRRRQRHDLWQRVKEYNDD